MGQAAGDVSESVFAPSSIADTSIGGMAAGGTAVVGITTTGTDTSGMAVQGAPASDSGTVVKRARGKRSRGACGSVSLSKETVLSGCGQHAEGIVAESAVFPMVERTVIDSGVSGFSRDEKVQNLPARRSSSELSAHQMACGCPGASALEPMRACSSVNPPLPLVDQSVIPPGFEEAFMSFSVAWTEAAARDDHRHVSAVTPAAHRKAQDQLLLAAIQPPAAFRTRLQKIAYEGATAAPYPRRNCPEHRDTNDHCPERSRRIYGFSE